MSALLCLALNVYFEARGEPTLLSMAAPAHVVLNRVKDERYPNDICSVVKQAKTYSNWFPIKNKCQFSWYCDGRSDKPLDENAFNFSFLIAKLVLTGRIKDVTSGAPHYHAAANQHNSTDETAPVIDTKRMGTAFGRHFGQGKGQSPKNAHEPKQQPGPAVPLDVQLASYLI